MANKKISELPNASALTGGELVELVQSGSNVKVTTQQIADLASGGASDWGYIGGTITDQTDLVSYVSSQISSAVAGLLDLRGNFDASGGSYPSSGGSGTAGAILKADTWIISVAGTLPTGQVVSVGDLIIALVDSPGNTQANWGRLEMNLMQATSSVAGIVKLYTDLSSSNTDGSPSQAAVVTGLALKKNIANTTPSTVTTSGSLTINSVSGSLLTLDCASKEESKFKYVGDTTPLSIALDNFPEGAYCLLQIERTTNTNVNVRFKNKTYLLGNTQLIDNGKDALVIRGRSSGRTVAVLGFYSSGEVGAEDNQSSPTTTNLVNLLKFLEDTEL